VRRKSKKAGNLQANRPKTKDSNMKQVSYHKQKIKPEKRIIPKSYTLRQFRSLQKRHEEQESSISILGFLAWLEAREKRNDSRLRNRFYGIE